MSRRYKWYGYVRNVVRDYRRMARERDGLPRPEREELRAVERAFEQTKALPDGDVRLQVVSMVLIDGSHTLEGAAVAAHLSYHSARNKLNDFLRLVAKGLGRI